MIGRWRSALQRLSPRVRALALGIVVLGVVVLMLALTGKNRERSHRPASRAPITDKTSGARQRGAAVSATQLARARRAARQFLGGYLAFAYGQASASSVSAVAPALRQHLGRGHALVAPVERRRRPHVVVLIALGQRPDVVVAAALVDDGGIANYALGLTVRRTSRGWLVSHVDGG